MIGSFSLVAKEVAQNIAETNLETAKSEITELPDKIGELSEVESLPDKVELVPEEDLQSSITQVTNSSVEKKDTATDDVSESDYPSSYKERIDRTPREISDRGEWTGDRGESTYIPSDEEIKKC